MKSNQISNKKGDFIIFSKRLYDVLKVVHARTYNKQLLNAFIIFTRFSVQIFRIIMFELRFVPTQKGIFSIIKVEDLHSLD